MKLGIFAYNFKHWKTQQGILNLVMAGMKPSLIIAADPVNLNFDTPRSKIRTSQKDPYLVHPKNIAKTFDIDYFVEKHNSRETREIINKYNLDLGIILGARILKPISINPFKIGVLNMHPGILPDNRGLDTIKWAIIDDIEQGVTTHLIDSKIDKGLMIEREVIKIYHDDTLLDIDLRIKHLEQKLMLTSIKIIKKTGIKKLKTLGDGKYNKHVPYGIEKTLNEKFKGYKNARSN